LLISKDRKKDWILRNQKCSMTSKTLNKTAIIKVYLC